MADKDTGDQPSVDLDPQSPEGPGVAPPAGPVSSQDSGGGGGKTTEEQLSGIYDQMTKIIQDNSQHYQEKLRETAPIYEALRREMSQPMPQQPQYDTSAISQNRQQMMHILQGQGKPSGLDLGGLAMGIIGMGLAAAFGHKHPAALWGAMDGLGKALQARNQGNEAASNRNWQRYMQMNELLRQELGDRYEQYHQAMESRRTSEQQKLDMLNLIAQQDHDWQLSQKATMGGLADVAKLIEGKQKLIDAHSKQSWQLMKEWYKSHGRGAEIEAYKSRIEHDAPWIGDMDDPSHPERWRQAQDVLTFDEFDKEYKARTKQKPSAEKKGDRFGLGPPPLQPSARDESDVEQMTPEMEEPPYTTTVPQSQWGKDLDKFMAPEYPQRGGTALGKLEDYEQPMEENP